MEVFLALQRPTVLIQFPTGWQLGPTIPTARCRPWKTTISEPCSAWANENEAWLNIRVMGPKVWNLSVSRSSCLPWPQWSQAPGWNLCPTIHTKSLFLAFGHAFHFIFKLPILNSGPFAWDPNNYLPLVSLMWLDPRWGSGSIWICSPRNKLPLPDYNFLLSPDTSMALSLLIILRASVTLMVVCLRLELLPLEHWNMDFWPQSMGVSPTAMLISLRDIMRE